jgi:hypothetical protein
MKVKEKQQVDYIRERNTVKLSQNDVKKKKKGLLPLLSSMRSEPTDGPKSRYVASYLCSTEKYVQMNPISLEKKTKPGDDMEIDTDNNNDHHAPSSSQS